MNLTLRQDRRRAVSGILVAVIIFAMLFTAGTGYLLFQARSDNSSYQAKIQALQQRAQVSQEQLAFRVNINKSSGNPDVTVSDTGAFPISVVSTFVGDSTGKVIRPPGVMTLGVSGTNATGPLNLNVGGTGNFTITKYSYASGTIYVALVTSRGNVFAQQYPFDNSINGSRSFSNVTISLIGPNAGGAGGNSLVVVMSATPVQVFSGPCPGPQCIIDTVTLYNYSPTPMTNASLHPTVPWSNVTGTAELINSSCSGPYASTGTLDSNGTIPGYSGTGVAPHVYFLCTYAPQTGAVGGLASFSGWAFATQNKTVLESAAVVSNLVQIGGTTNVFAQGIFSTNFFFFKYSSCTNAPNGGGGYGSFSYSTACTTNIAPGWPPSSPNKLPEGAVISGGSNYYVAFYIQITNNYNTTVPLLQYTFVQVDASGTGGETDWWLVGTNTTMSNGAYYPTYNPGASPLLPTLTPYPSDCNVVNPKTNVPTDKDCIYVNPGQTVTITLAACGYSSSNWNWGGSQYGDSWDNGINTVGCISGGSTPSIPTVGDANAATTVISFWYKNQTLTEDIAFNGIAFTS
ncbi:MAG: hypothetical protein ABSB29_09745 [Nitrososphaerales archaeon]|jgi:hypothetical protein